MYHYCDSEPDDDVYVDDEPTNDSWLVPCPCRAGGSREPDATIITDPRYVIPPGTEGTPVCAWCLDRTAITTVMANAWLEERWRESYKRFLTQDGATASTTR